MTHSHLTRSICCGNSKSNRIASGVVIGSLLFGALITSVGASANEVRLDNRLRARFETVQEVQVQAPNSRLFAQTALRRFYQERLFAPVWLTDRGTKPQFRALVDTVLSANAHGLNPADYHAEALQRLSALEANTTLGIGERVELELLASDAALLFASHLLAGRVNPRTIDAEWFADMRGGDVVQIVERIVSDGDIAAGYAALAPQAPGYGRLKKALHDWRSLTATGPTLPPGEILKPGMRGPRVEQLRKQLAIPARNDDSTDLYDAGLLAAVKRFQLSRGLEDDGMVGPATLRLLNQHPDDVIDMLIANLERWRWLPEDLGERHILVNIAAFRLQARERYQTQLEMDVIVGRSYRKTPVLSAPMRYLVLNPYWEVPHSIATKDLLPKFRTDSGYFRSMGFELLNGWGPQHQKVDISTINWQQVSAKNFPYRLRQLPGPKNALGQIKFMLPNAHAIYLHDTASPELFARSQRTFSSGCIRLQNPKALLKWVTNDQVNWPDEKTGPDRAVPLAKSLPVHLQYWTAWVEPDGHLELRADVYERDAVLLAALREAHP